MLETASCAFSGPIYKRYPNVLKNGLKLGQNRLTEVFGGNSGAITETIKTIRAWVDMRLA